MLMRTDWSKRTGAEYLNMREDGAHTPGPTGDAIKFLVEDRARSSASAPRPWGTDAGQATHLSPPYPAHYLLHGANKYGLQCLANLDQLPATGARILVCPPLKIKNGSGSPLRVLALVDRSAIHERQVCHGHRRQRRHRQEYLRAPARGRLHGAEPVAARSEDSHERLIDHPVDLADGGATREAHGDDHCAQSMRSRRLCTMPASFGRTSSRTSSSGTSST